MKPSMESGAPACAAFELRQFVDRQINFGALREFADATDKLQEPGADLDEGSAYLDGGEVAFKPRAAACTSCLGVAYLSRDGSVQADTCGLTGQCEFEWAKKYPQEYRDIQNGAMNGQLGCGAEIGCCALIGMVDQNGTCAPILLRGTCQVAERGHNWRARRNNALAEEELIAPEAGIPVFDGADSGREE